MDQTKFNQIHQERQAPHRTIGFGKPLPNQPRGGKSLVETKRDAFIGMVKMGWSQCPTYNVPIIDSVTLHYDGPLTTTQIGQTFGPTINPLGANVQSPPPGCTQVDTTFAEPGKFQTFAFVCAIQWLCDVEPMTFAAKVNSVVAPTSSIPKVVSPDMFVTQIDGSGSGDQTAAGSLGASATAGGVNMTTLGNFNPGILDWAGWSEQMFYYMSRGYNLFWQAGHNQNLLNDTLRYTAFVPTNAQESSASSSEQAILFALRRTNAYYRASLASTKIALLIDRVRLGNKSLGGTAGLSVFHPSRAYETTGVTFGGAGLLSKLLKGNSEFRRLTQPVMFWPGQPIGLRAQVAASDDQILMQQWMDASFAGGATGLGGNVAPASFTEDANIAVGNTIAGTSGTTGVEPSLDSVEVDNSLGLQAARDYYKGGSWKLKVAFKGFELTPDQADMWNNDKSLQDAVKAECGCGMVFPGS